MINISQSIKVLMETFIQGLKEINVDSQDEFEDEHALLRQKFIDGVLRLRDEYPEMLFINYKNNITDTEAAAIFKKIASNVSTHYNIPAIPSNDYYIDEIQHEKIVTPVFMDSLDSYNDIYINPKDDAKLQLNQFLLGLLLSMPIKKVRFNFVDLSRSFLADFFYTNVNPVIYNQKPSTDISELKEFLKKSNDKVLKNVQRYGDIRKFNEKNKTISEPYEVIVLLDNMDGDRKNKYEECNVELSALKRSCAAGGIFILDFISTDKKKVLPKKCQLFIEVEDHCTNKLQVVQYTKEVTKLGIKESKDLIDKGYCMLYDEIETKRAIPIASGYKKLGVLVTLIDSDSCEEIEYEDGESESQSVNVFKIDNSIVMVNMITQIPNLQKACLEYINNSALQEDKLQVISGNYEAMYQAPYENLLDKITVPVGKEGLSDVNFTMDLVSHVHSFILGQSGSGKSVFLHNVISGAMMKYAPEDLELYLLDFKLGGVEFNRYKNEKHVHAMLVDNSDQQITLEILRELRERMTERGKLLRSAGVTNIKEYNQQNSDKKLPHILFIADECHEMFNAEGIAKQVHLAISEIVTKIAKEGRNQGVHLVMATQTLSGAVISNEILNNVSDHYLLKCATSDSERLVNNSSKITSKLTTGNVYYHHVDENATFQAFYADKGKTAEIISAIKDKTLHSANNNLFYFNGASQFTFTPSVISQHTKLCSKKAVAFAGKSINIQQEDVIIPLSNDFSENILVLGLNDVWQATRATMNLLLTLLSTAKCRKEDHPIRVINCMFDDDDNTYLEQLEALESAGLIEILSSRRRLSYLHDLAEDIITGNERKEIIFIIGQDRFREWKIDMPFENNDSTQSERELMTMSNWNRPNTSSKSIKSVSEAMDIILTKGSELGVHTILQLENPTNFLFSDCITSAGVNQRFKHLILLKSEEKTFSRFGLRDDIHLEMLSKESERLRAYYYNGDSDTYTLFTPYSDMDKETFNKFIKSL